MTPPDMRLALFLRIASLLIIVGLVIEIVSLLWFHPLSFALFAFVGATITIVGIAVYLLSLVFVTTPSGGNRDVS